MRIRQIWIQDKKEEGGASKPRERLSSERRHHTLDLDIVREKGSLQREQLELQQAAFFLVERGGGCFLKNGIDRMAKVLKPKGSTSRGVWALEQNT
jgi:hypothetical protein